MADKLVGIAPAEVVMVGGIGRIDPFRIGSHAVFVFHPVDPFDTPVDGIVEFTAAECPVVESSSFNRVFRCAGHRIDHAAQCAGADIGGLGHRNNINFITDLGKPFDIGVGLDVVDGREVGAHPHQLFADVLGGGGVSRNVTRLEPASGDLAELEVLVGFKPVGDGGRLAEISKDAIVVAEGIDIVADHVCHDVGAGQRLHIRISFLYSSEESIQLFISGIVFRSDIEVVFRKAQLVGDCFVGADTDCVAPFLHHWNTGQEITNVAGV